MCCLNFVKIFAWNRMTPPPPTLCYPFISTVLQNSPKLSQVVSIEFVKIMKRTKCNISWPRPEIRGEGSENSVRLFGQYRVGNGVIWTWWGGGRGARGARKWPCFVLSKPFHFHLGHNCNQKSELSFIWIWKRPAAKKHDLKLSFTFPCKPLSRKDRQTHVICSVFAPAIWFWVILVNRKI